MTEARRSGGRRGTTVAAITGLAEGERLAELEARLVQLEQRAKPARPWPKLDRQGHAARSR